jgi:hypothetical protein
MDGVIGHIAQLSPLTRAARDAERIVVGIFVWL